MSPLVDARVLVVGAGAIGGITAAGIEGAVAGLVVLDANPEHVVALRDPGLRLDRLGTERTVRLDAYASVDELTGTFDFALIALKAPTLEAALTPLAARDIVETYVALGNGLVHDRIGALVGRERLIACTVEWGATNVGPGHLRQTTDNPFVIGELDGPARPRTERLADVLAPVADVRVTDNIAGQLWSKLLVNSSLSGLGVVGGCTYGEVAGDPAGRLAIHALWSEGYRLGVAQQLELEPVLGVGAGDLATDDPSDYDDALRIVVAHAGATKASMLQDVERGLLTEVDVINGAVAERARSLGRVAPCNERVVELVHSFERGERTPSTTLFGEIVAAAG